MATPGGGTGGNGGHGDDDGVLRVNVWSTPRTLSTALLYSFNQVRAMCRMCTVDLVCCQSNRIE